ncbi:hypothetical protein V6N11_002113 [Hibiscus sabdariffa]|uniref:Uncharacterized protein n=1 Tax=Hibiscus sabdariffa TaxID=183260 RepID=A0ABR2QV28_9ROSI
MNANSPYKQPASDLRLSPITSPSGSSIVGGGGGGACDSGWAMPFSMLGSHQSGDDEMINGERSGGGDGSWKKDGECEERIIRRGVGFQMFWCLGIVN